MTFLEIGCGEGGSLQLWKRYLGPFAQIVGIDIGKAPSTTQWTAGIVFDFPVAKEGRTFRIDNFTCLIVGTMYICANSVPRVYFNLDI